MILEHDMMILKSKQVSEGDGHFRLEAQYKIYCSAKKKGGGVIC